MTGFSALVTPTLAWAQDAATPSDADTAMPETSVAILGTFLVAVLALISMAWLRRRWSREQIRANHFQLMTASLEAALAATPVPYAGWLATGQPIASQSFLERLGLEQLLGFDAVLEHFAPADRARLEAAFGDLRRDGTAFDIALADSRGETVHLAGRRGQSAYTLPDGNPAVIDMIWLVTA